MTARIRRKQHSSVACVMGEVDLVRALGLAGIGSAVFAPPGNPARYARTVTECLEWVNPRAEPEAVVDRLLEFARAQQRPPVLFYDGDWDLLVVSRHRQALGEAFRFVVADEQTVESLTDKDRFARLAERLELPVPRSRRLTDATGPADLDLTYPVVIKPLTRQRATWHALGAGAKALYAEDADAVAAVAAALSAAGTEAVVQEYVPGPESRIASYHVYVDAEGEIAAEFTGRKLRTHPPSLGYSTALIVSDIEDVRALGRHVVDRLGLGGVAKMDFKRAPDGTLSLLEINARFSLWHHPGALSGVNIPALVFADLTGTQRPEPLPKRAEVSWCSHRHDLSAARHAGVGLGRWIAWSLRCPAKSGFSWDDPLPLVRALAWRAGARARSAVGRG